MSYKLHFGINICSCLPQESTKMDPAETTLVCLALTTRKSKKHSDHYRRLTRAFNTMKKIHAQGKYYTPDFTDSCTCMLLKTHAIRIVITWTGQVQKSVQQMTYYHHFSVIVTVCRGLGAQGIYSTHGTPSFMHPLWLQKRNSGCILPLSYAFFALSTSVGH